VTRPGIAIALCFGLGGIAAAIGGYLWVAIVLWVAAVLAYWRLP
jgi:hypothetical protein